MVFKRRGVSPLPPGKAALSTPPFDTSFEKLRTTQGEANEGAARDEGVFDNPVCGPYG